MGIIYIFDVSTKISGSERYERKPWHWDPSFAYVSEHPLFIPTPLFYSYTVRKWIITLT